MRRHPSRKLHPDKRNDKDLALGLCQILTVKHYPRREANVVKRKIVGPVTISNSYFLYLYVHTDTYSQTYTHSGPVPFQHSPGYVRKLENTGCLVVCCTTLAWSLKECGVCVEGWK